MSPNTRLSFGPSRRAAELDLRRLSIHSDSELMVKQFNGEYSVKNPELKDLYDEARSLARRFEAVALSHVRRAANRSRRRALQRRARRPASRTVWQIADSKAEVGRHGAARSQRRSGRAGGRMSAGGSAPATAPAGPTAEQVWEQLWSVLEDGGVLKSRRTK